MLNPQQIQSLKSIAPSGGVGGVGGMNNSIPMTPDQAKASFNSNPVPASTSGYVNHMNDNTAEQQANNQSVNTGVKNFGSDVATDWNNLKTDVATTGNPLVQGAKIAKDVTAPIGDAFKEGFNTLTDIISNNPEVQKFAMGNTAGNVLNTVSGVGQEANTLSQPAQQALKGWAQQHPQVASFLSSIAQTASNVAGVVGAPEAAGVAGDIAGEAGALAGRGVSAATDAARTVAEPIANAVRPAIDAVSGGVSKVADTATNIGGKVRQAVAPTLTPEEAVGQIIQGETSDIPSAQRALSSTDMTGVKTYQQALDRVNSQIKPLSEQVDSEFMKNPEGKSIKSYEQSVGEEKSSVRVNYVRQAIDDLKDFYGKTNNASGLSKMKALENRAKINGLNNKDINNLARLHGREINAFYANGEAASGLTKQAAENTRTGLKAIARRGLGGKTAQALDAKLTDLYNLRVHFEKMVEKVHKAANTTTKTGIIPRTIGAGVKYADIFTGSPLKAIGKAMGSIGSSDKISAVELEKNLARNLRTIKRGK